MPFTFDRQALSGYGELAIDVVVAIARLVEHITKENTADIITAIRAVLRVFSLVIRGRMDKESATKMIEEIGMRFQDRPGSTE